MVTFSPEWVNIASMPYREFGVEELSRGLRAAGVGLWAWDLETRAVRFSPELGALFGFSEGAFDGTVESVLAQVHDDDLPRVREEVERTLAEGRHEFTAEARLKPRGGRVRWLRSRGQTPSDTGARQMFGAVVDITDRKEAERAALEAAERFRLFTQLTSDYVYDAPSATGVPGIVVGSFERITGYSPEELEELGGWSAIVHPEDRARTFDTAFAAEGGRGYALEYRIVRRDGAIRWLRDRGQPVMDPDTGRPVRFRGGVQDITELKELEQRLLQAQRMDAFAELSGRVAHDFNNLLTIVLGAIGLIARKASALPAELGTYLGAAQEALDRATELTRSLLTFGRHSVERAEVVDLRQELERGSLLEGLPGGAEEVRVVIAPDLDGSVQVLADREELAQALRHLVQNAKDAVAGGGRVEIRLRARELDGEHADRPADLPRGRYATLEVSDEGEGIPEEHLARIFEPYFTTKPSGRGAGLGLAIAYGVARKHGGTLSVRSERGVGTCFSLWLPRSDHRPSAHPEPPVRGARAGADRLLVVEDDAGVRSMLAHILESHGYRVDAVSSAEEALALSDEELCAHDLLVSDVRLGGMDGVALAVAVLARCPTLSVVLVSGYAEEAQREGIGAHGFRFLPKPFTPNELVAVVGETLETRDVPV